MYLDICFPVDGGPVPIDHAYPLYAALSHAAPAFHDARTRVRFAPISGARCEPGVLAIMPSSRLRVRLPSDKITTILQLAGSSLSVGKQVIRVGVPTVQALRPATSVAARVVTFKNSLDPSGFLATARARLDQLGIAGEPAIPILLSGPHTGQPCRRVLRIKDRRVIGFALQVVGLSAEESMRLQEEGLGGRCRIGCGFFMPLRPRE